MKQPHIVMTRRPRRSAGASLLTAIFLLVVLAGLAAAVVSLTTAQRSSSALDTVGTRALQAARAGMEWGLYQQLQAATPACLAAKTSFKLPAGNALSVFTVTVECVTASNGTVLKVTACNKPAAGGCPNPSTDPDYVQRVLQAQI